jgi:hypothetical protein
VWAVLASALSRAWSAAVVSVAAPVRVVLVLVFPAIELVSELAQVVWPAGLVVAWEVATLLSPEVENREAAPLATVLRWAAVWLNAEE